MLNRRFNGFFVFSNSTDRPLGWADVGVLSFVIVVLAVSVHLALDAPETVAGPTISLSPTALPYYALRSVGRMAAAYALSLIVALIYGRVAATHHRAGLVLLPLLDVLQSVPILSFLPVVLLGLIAVLPERLAVEMTAIALIFTSQVWNLVYTWYQSLTTLPTDLREASTIFRFGSWLRFRTLELPFAGIGLIWNSMMSWAGGWFFLMAAEIFTVGDRDFRLPGLGAYLHEAAAQNDYGAMAWGIAALVIVVLLLDQFVWHPLLAWSDRFKLEMVENDEPPSSWFYDLLRGSRGSQAALRAVMRPINHGVDALLRRLLPASPSPRAAQVTRGRPWAGYLVSAVLAIAVLVALFWTGQMLFVVPLAQWRDIAVGLGVTLLRVALALVIALAWTIPVGVLIGTNARAARLLQPLVQVFASIPATALFPVLLLGLVKLPGGLNIAAVLLMLLGMQWYLLFNVIAGATAIPQDLKYTSTLLGLGRFDRWRTLILPALFPYAITGAITASGGAWNASIVAEYFQLGDRTLHATGIGATIAQATAAGDYHLLLASTLVMVLVVVLINRLLWRRLYHRAEERFRME
ncbi:MAG TPA: ABC transporter permease subunit [Aggregatilinea sp.]|uniref:ABC transporter permease n=1 Tax=Aggregatilinea sp. TaxID=2806333 RepID=UPI002B941FEF|nr:ABC transporter permease subunit [Aggregatilinea sp.]HML21443.1 ABC transporter permease subunit [Aggregatilinea sp.]